MTAGKVKVDLQFDAGGVQTRLGHSGVNGNPQEIPNDFVWIFAGGTPPNAFLKKIGVGFGTRDMTLEASNEAKQAALSKKQLAQAALTNQ